MKTRIYFIRKYRNGSITIYGNRGRTNYDGYTVSKARADYMCKTSRDPWKNTRYTVD
jgi:hypothetical protein